MRTRTNHLVGTAVALCLAMGVSACGSSDEATPDGGSEATAVSQSDRDDGPDSVTTVPDRASRAPASLPERVPQPDRPATTVTGEVPDELLAPVVADAAARAGVEPTDGDVITAQEMVWPDGSLGCAEPGQTYTQAPVPGYWVVIEIDSLAFDYRLDDRGFFKLCTSPFSGTGGTSPSS